MSYYKKKQPVILEGQTFESITAAAKYIGADISCIAWALKCNKDRKYKNLSVRYADDKMEAAAVANITTMLKRHSANCKKRRQNKLMNSAKNCPIYCETTGKTFKTLKEAAKVANVSGYTLSTKTEIAGRFVDKAGNVYKRLRPMNHRTNKTYTDTGDTLKFERPSGYIKEVNEKPVEQPKPTLSGIQLAQTILKGKAIDYIQNNNFELAKELLDVVKQIKE